MVYAEEKDKVFLNIYKIKTIKTKQNKTKKQALLFSCA